MKKFFSLLSILTFLSMLFAFNSLTAKAEDTVTCDAKVVVHYHRWDGVYNDKEFWTWDAGTGGAKDAVAITGSDSFGATANFTVCSDAKDSIGLIPKVIGSWDYKDGIDTDNKDGIDNHMIDVTDIRGTTNTKDVYVLQGTKDVYYQDPTYTTNFGKTGFGTLVVVYYNVSDMDKWQDFWTWSTGTGAKSDDILFNYWAGLDGQTDPELFRVAVVNIAPDAGDQIGFVLRQEKAWGTKDTAWASSLTADETDDNGHTYKTNGDRLINVSDIKGTGTKFVFVVGGVKTIFEDFDQFKAEAFKFEFSSAEFKSKKALTINFNQDLAYGETGPDKTKFEVKDQNGTVLPISQVTFDSLKTSGKTFNIVLGSNIEQNKTYTVTYNFEQFGVQKTTSIDATVADNVFATPQTPATPQPEAKVNATALIVGGVVVVVAAGAGVAVLLTRKK